MSAGDNETCAVKTDNTVVCWGNNAYGELGIAPPVTDGGEPYVFTPQVVPGLANVAHVVVGYYHACAVTWDDHVMCWGDNEYGQLGVASIDGGASFSLTPMRTLYRSVFRITSRAHSGGYCGLGDDVHLLKIAIHEVHVRAVRTEGRKIGSRVDGGQKARRIRAIRNLARPIPPLQKLHQ